MIRAVMICDKCKIRCANAVNGQHRGAHLLREHLTLRNPSWKTSNQQRGWNSSDLCEQCQETK